MDPEEINSSTADTVIPEAVNDINLIPEAAANTKSAPRSPGTTAVPEVSTTVSQNGQQTPGPRGVADRLMWLGEFVEENRESPAFPGAWL